MLEGWNNKAGIVEQWKNGKMGKKRWERASFRYVFEPNIPILHHSNIPYLMG
jgi:hypothetical protein